MTTLHNDKLVIKEQLHLPPILVEQGDVLRTEIEVVCVVNEAPLEFRGIVDNPSDDSRVLLLVLLLGEADTLVFEHIVSPIQDALPVANLVGRLPLLPYDEECPEHVDTIESGEVEVASVKHIASQRLVFEPVHRVDIMYPGCCDSVEYGYFRNDVNLSMNPDARLVCF